MKIVVKLFHEIIIKSRPVRKLFTKQLHYNLENILKPISSEIKVYKRWDKIDITIPDSLDQQLKTNVLERLQCMPGIDFFMIVETIEFETLSDISEFCIERFKDRLEGKTFCVRVKRKGKHEFTSNDAEKYIGGGLLANTDVKKVVLKNPEEEVYLEINQNQADIVSKKVKGLGGYPLGKQESTISLISGGFDSGVSSFLMTRRGVKTHFCFFNLGGMAHEIGVKQVAYYLWNKYASSHKVKFISIPFEGVVEEILKSIDPSLMGVALKRMMLRVADRVAKDLGVDSIVTGEAIGQVSSQTLTNLNVIEQASNTLVLRPLIAMDKQEIIQKAKAIGTEEFAANMPEYCGVISQKPSTKVKLEKMLKAEESFNFEVLDQAFDNKALISIEKVLDGLDTDTDVELTAVPHVGDIVIDIRHPEEQETHPLVLTNNAVLKIPFYSISRRFSELDKTHNYLLYCDKGVMSKVQAHHLKMQGYDNVKVLRA
ncbi:tRNA uracil 4-sulfurtransferase ThiI [Pleionea sediminis]|uniref:tRNA uracil 4-sulfurtransferase ThiI n=1 Tax=Pleionea sediminis TaxID=2569479 RepID=UPI0011871B7A|nr:tRNA uracil 4-sulfurtransferase ThiI [Pleionea sediminis]